MNYEQAMEYIHAVQWAGHKPGLTRTRTLLAALGDPHKKLQFVHVAGTNGKGSTAAMMASCRVGAATPPMLSVSLEASMTTSVIAVSLKVMVTFTSPMPVAVPVYVPGV